MGTGSYGRVIVTRDRETSEFYALKLLSITHVIQLKQVIPVARTSSPSVLRCLQTDHVNSEKEILSAISHPFIIRLYWTHHSDQFLYMLLEYIPGGELFSYMRRRSTLDLKSSLFYICEIILAFEYLHSLQVVYRESTRERTVLSHRGEFIRRR